jgi:hypothetical protein
LLICPAFTEAADPPFEPVKPPDWVYDVTRMVFCTPGEIPDAVEAGAQVVQTNICWPYYPLRRDGGKGLAENEAKQLRDAVGACHRRGAKFVLGLPPFPPVNLMAAHPDWRVKSDPVADVTKVVAKEDDLGTRLGCNNGPWGDYLIDICAELMADYDLDGYSFDGNYHAAVCHCPACTEKYKRGTGRDVPARANLDDVPYREYLVWRGERLEDHFRALQKKLKSAKPDAVLINWSVNAGRYGHFLFSPRAMPTRLNLLFDMPMQEWWLDETNQGASVAPAFGAAYIRAAAGGRPSACEPYLMSRGNPYGNESFPPHEQVVRFMLALANGSMPASILSWAGHDKGSAAALKEVERRQRWVTRATPMPWAAMLVSEQTRQFHAYKDIEERFLPHVFGVFRAAAEEHQPLGLLNDWDLDAATLSKYRALVLPNAAALSDAQVQAVREYVRGGGGLVATCETSLFDELGRPRKDFALADVFGVNYRGHPAPGGAQRPPLDANFAVVADDAYWKERVGVGRLVWTDHALVKDEKLAELVPLRNVIFRGPQVLVSEPADPSAVAVRLTPEASTAPPPPAVVVRPFGKGRVVYFAAGVDAGLWSYAFPYQRRLVARAVELAAGGPPPVRVVAPMCVQSTFFEQKDATGERLIVHLFNGLDTAANHGLPKSAVPLREETVPVHGIRLRFPSGTFARFHVEPGGVEIEPAQDGGGLQVRVPPLEVHQMLVAERG